MDIHILLSCLENERVALEHSQAVDKFLQETEYLREKPLKRRFFNNNRKSDLLFPMTIIGVLAVLIVFFHML